MPTPMRRRCYIKIIAPGKLHITNSYDNKIFTFEKGMSTIVDLVNLKKVKYTTFSSLPAFNANVTYTNGGFNVHVMNQQDSHFLGALDFYDGPREKDFRCVIVED